MYYGVQFRNPLTLVALLVLAGLGYFVFNWVGNPCRHDGERVKTYRSGETESRWICRGGEMQGPATFYFKSGGVRAQGQFVDSTQDGEWTFFDEAGKQTKKEFFSHGEKLDRSADE